MKTLSEKWQDLTTEAEAVDCDVRGFRESTLMTWGDFSYSWAKAYRLELHSELRGLEADLDSGENRLLMDRIDLTEHWLKIAVKLYSEQKQMEAEFFDGQPTH